MACTGRNLEIAPDEGVACHERVGEMHQFLEMFGSWFMFRGRPEGPDGIGKKWREQAFLVNPCEILCDVILAVRDFP